MKTITYPRVVLVLLLVSAITHTLWTAMGAQPQSLRPYLGNLLMFPPFLLAAWLSHRASRTSTPTSRRAWRLIALGLLAWAAGQVVYTYLDVIARQPAFPSLADLGYLALIPCFALAILQFPRPAQGRWQLVNFVLDVAIFVTIFADILWITYARRTAEAYASEPLALGIALAYPFLDVVLGALLLVLIIWRPRDLTRLQLSLLSVGLLFFLTADVLYAYQNSVETYRLGRPLDSLWGWGCALFGGAAYATLSDRRTFYTEVQAREGHPSRASSLPLPHVVIIAAYALYIVVYLQTKQQAIGVGIVVATLLVLLRQVMALMINQRLTDQLSYQAEHDPLTGANNRSSFNRRLNLAIQDARAAGTQVGVFFVDLDRMKHINDSYGHGTGDLILQTISRRLAQLVGPHNTVVRFGGDEFVLVVQPLDRDSAAGMAQRMLAIMGEPVRIGQEQLQLTASIGITLCPAEAEDPSQALQNADMAMYYAKKRGKNGWSFFDRGAHTTALEHSQIERYLRQALDGGELELHYQPLFALQEARQVGFEALLRWDSPVLGIVAPSTMIPIVEERGLMNRLGDWVLESAIEQLKRWQADMPPGVYVSVNVSALQFAKPDFAEQVLSMLRRHEVAGEVLVLELTESVLLGNVEESVHKLQQLRGAGVRIALDDFGTGYSSLSYLRSLPVDILKIDRSFVHSLDEGSEVFVQAMLLLAHGLGITVVAEGIEDIVQAERLRSLGCDAGQGYLLGRPLPAAQLDIRPGHQLELIGTEAAGG